MDVEEEGEDLVTDKGEDNPMDEEVIEEVTDLMVEDNHTDKVAKEETHTEIDNLMVEDMEEEEDMEETLEAIEEDRIQVKRINRNCLSEILILELMKTILDLSFKKRDINLTMFTW